MDDQILPIVTGRVVSPNITCGFAINGRLCVIKEGTAPILHKFVGQPVENLIDWVGNKLKGCIDYE